MIIHHNNPQWLDNPFTHIRGVTLQVDPALRDYQWRVDGGKAKDITEGTAAQVRKLAQVQVQVLGAQLTLF